LNSSHHLVEFSHAFFWGGGGEWQGADTRRFRDPHSLDFKPSLFHRVQQGPQPNLVVPPLFGKNLIEVNLFLRLYVLYLVGDASLSELHILTLPIPFLRVSSSCIKYQVPSVQWICMECIPIGDPVLSVFPSSLVHDHMLCESVLPKSWWLPC
jgi:hypothetical protein